MRKLAIKSIVLILTFLFSHVRAEESIVIDNWLINFDGTVCWATALITEDPINDEYDTSEDFQFTVSFHNGDTVPQFTIISVTPGKTVTSATVKFKDYKFEDTPKETIKQLFYRSESNRIKIENIFHPKVHKIIQNKLESNKNILIEVPPLKNNISIIKNNKSIFIESGLEKRRKRFQLRNMKNEINCFDKLNEYQSDCLLIESYCDIIIKNDSNEAHLSEYFKKEIIKS